MRASQRQLLLVVILACGLVAALLFRAHSAPSSDGVEPQLQFTAAEIRTTLDRLRTPPGYHAAACVLQNDLPDTRCFSRSRSTVPSPAAVRSLVGELGARLYGTGYGLCDPQQAYRDILVRPRPALWQTWCGTFATLDSQQLHVTLLSTVLVHHGAVKPTERSLAPRPDGSGLLRGSQVAVEDYGMKPQPLPSGPA
jgi:hypothetical protein